MKEYLARFRQGSGVMGMNAIDYYREGSKIIKHSWANGGQSKMEVAIIPKSIAGYEKV